MDNELMQPINGKSFPSILNSRMSNGLPELTRVLEAFESADDYAFNGYATYLLENNLKEEFELFLYYLTLFRTNERVQHLLNMNNTPVKLIEHLIMFSYGYITNKGRPVDDVYDDLLNYLSYDKLLQLLTESTHIKRDKMLLFFLLTKLDTKYIDLFFGRCPDVEKTVRSFLFLPEESIYQIIYRNVSLFEYILGILPVYVE